MPIGKHSPAGGPYEARGRLLQSAALHDGMRGSIEELFSRAGDASLSRERRAGATLPGHLDEAMLELG